MNIKFLIPLLTSLLIASTFLVSCDGSDSSGMSITNPPVDQRPVVTNPITSADIPNLETLYVGLTREEAISVAADQGHIYRVVSIDGTSLPVTSDFVIGRINASIVSNRVVSINVENIDF